MRSRNSNRVQDLRYMQLDISVESAKELPGISFTNTIQYCEYISLISSNDLGMICLLKVGFNKPDDLYRENPAFEIIDVISKSENSALIKAQTLGPLPRLFSKNDEVWWITPTLVNQSGMKITLRGTPKGMSELRKELHKLVGNGYKIKLGSESINNPEFMEMLPEKQRAVLNKAIEMGYYTRPRGCTQRDIAREMDLKQATISEHLQTAEARIINTLTGK